MPTCSILILLKQLTKKHKIFGVNILGVVNEDLGPKSTSFHRFVDPIQTSMLAGQITPDFLETMVPPVQALQTDCA